MKLQFRCQPIEANLGPRHLPEWHSPERSNISYILLLTVILLNVEWSSSQTNFLVLSFCHLSFYRMSWRRANLGGSGEKFSKQFNATEFHWPKRDFSELPICRSTRHSVVTASHLIVTSSRVFVITCYVTWSIITVSTYLFLRVPTYLFVTRMTYLFFVVLTYLFVTVSTYLYVTASTDLFVTVSYYLLGSVSKDYFVIISHGLFSYVLLYMDINVTWSFGHRITLLIHHSDVKLYWKRVKWLLCHCIVWLVLYCAPLHICHNDTWFFHHRIT